MTLLIVYSRTYMQDWDHVARHRRLRDVLEIACAWPASTFLQWPKSKRRRK
jgi:hypothetical protein